MDLTAWLLRHTPPRPLLVAAPGGAAVRLAVERVVRESGWRPALSPAEANILVVAGTPGHDLEPYLRRVWQLIPGPRARADVATPEAAAHGFDAAVRSIHDVGHQRIRARDPDAAPRRDQAGRNSPDSEDMDGMDLPGGVPMADRAADRDGLKLDQLHLPLGPVLAFWPAGLIVRTQLQGDIVAHATAEVVGLDTAGGRSFWLSAEGHGAGSERVRLAVARRLDACAALLAVAGWADADAGARRLRDTALSATSTADIADLAVPVRKWAGRVRRSRTLRWLLTGIGEVPDQPGTPAELVGDALTRLYRWIDSATRSGAAGDDTPRPADEAVVRARWAVEALPRLLGGCELASARLIVASMDLDTDVLGRRQVTHG